MQISNIILLISAELFFISSLYFLFSAKKQPKFYNAFLVSIVTAVSSLIMYQGQLIGASVDGDALYYTRWLGYIASCTVLMFTIAKAVDLPRKYYLTLFYTTGITMLTGALASAASGWIMIAYFALGAITYAKMMYLLFKQAQKPLGFIAKYIHFGWSAFPLIFILSPEGFGVISLSISMIAYLILDLCTKIIFYLELHKRSKA